MKNNFRMTSAALVAALTIVAEARAQGTPPPPPATERTVTIVPGPEYQAGPTKRKLLGDGWREVWVTPVNVPVLDLSRYGGGLKLVRRAGGNQTLTLHLAEEKGWREHLFRSVNKFPVAQAMPPEIKGTLLGDIIQDHVSSLFPAGALMVPPFLEAVGALHVTPVLYVMPDDPRLGAYKDSVAGMLGTLELSPQEAPNDEPGFAGSRKIISGDAFLEVVEESRMNHLDEREFLAIRLIDFLVNDNDRTADNVRFARYGKDSAFNWRPLPRDRDRAFVNARGILIDYLVRPIYAKLTGFGPRYDLKALTFESHNLDRRLLQRLTLSDMEEVARRVQRTIDNTVIDNAIAALPPSWRTRTGADDRLRSALRTRRDHLPEFTREFYRWLSGEVDVHGTDQKEKATVTRQTDGRVTVVLKGAEDSASVEPFFSRTFLPSETREVRVYLHGGGDSAVVRGASSDDIRVRIIGGRGDDFLADSAGGDATRFYDSQGENRFVTRSGTRVNLQEWIPPKQGAGVRFDAPWRPDWGKSLGWGPAFDYKDGAGLIVGFGPRYTAYGFRRLPHHWKASANFLLALGSGKPGVSVDVDHRKENSPLALTLAARATKFEAFRFYGLGNDTRRASTDLALVDQDKIAIEPALVLYIGWRTREGIPGPFAKQGSAFPGLPPVIGKLTAGPVLLWTDADPDPGSPFANEFAEGRDVKGRVGARLALDMDQASRGPASERGWTFNGELTGYPPLWDVEESFNTARAVGAVYLPLPGEAAHVALRAGGAVASGPFPLQHAPSIGGRETLRGYHYQRYSGETSAFGSAELRVPIGWTPLLVKWRTGVFGLADAGRVWFEQQSPGGWHTAVGGGIWLSSLGQTLSLAYAYGEQGRFYLQQGMSF
jgi:hypothetical protein